jgi:hypothetical protein
MIPDHQAPAVLWPCHDTEAERARRSTRSATHRSRTVSRRRFQIHTRPGPTGCVPPIGCARGSHSGTVAAESPCARVRNDRVERWGSRVHDQPRDRGRLPRTHRIRNRLDHRGVASSVVIWHIRPGHATDRPERTRRALRLVAVAFLGLAVVLAVASLRELLVVRARARASWASRT